MAVVAFDALGTLFSLEPLERRLGTAGLEGWFERLLHTAATLTLVGEFRPFDELAASTLATTVAKLELEVDQDAVLAGLRELPLFPDACEALERVSEAGHDAWVLTNGARESTEGLLEKAGLAELVVEVRSVEEVRAYKPHRRAYGLLTADATMIAAHAWDVRGAQAAGLHAVWIDRLERVWPFPDIEPTRRASDLVAAVELVSSRVVVEGE